MLETSTTCSDIVKPRQGAINIPLEHVKALRKLVDGRATDEIPDSSGLPMRVFLLAADDAQAIDRPEQHIIPYLVFRRKIPPCALAY